MNFALVLIVKILGIIRIRVKGEAEILEYTQSATSEYLTTVAKIRVTEHLKNITKIDSTCLFFFLFFADTISVDFYEFTSIGRCI